VCIITSILEKINILQANFQKLLTKRNPQVQPIQSQAEDSTLDDDQ